MWKSDGLAGLILNKGLQEEMGTMGKYDVAAYVWPAYTGRDKRSLMFLAGRDGRMAVCKNAVKKFRGNSWPRKPPVGLCGRGGSLCDGNGNRGGSGSRRQCFHI